ncbi:MAG: hypothetical protein IT359_07655 [Gemmatimonadaceae bacterium]|nr:hypothetical protein [Gemmatimonadaceae bacterium]
MRRWTILFIPHDTEEPRSFAVSDRALRWMAGGAAALILTGAVGLGAIAWWASSQRLQRAEARLAAESDVLGRTAAEMDSLRATVSALNGALDTIRHADARLSAAAGVAVPDSATLQTQAELRGSRAAADSLLRRAAFVAQRIGAMADSASARRPNEDRRLPLPSSSPRSSPQ